MNQSHFGLPMRHTGATRSARAAAAVIGKSLGTGVKLDSLTTENRAMRCDRNDPRNESHNANCYSCMKTRHAADECDVTRCLWCSLHSLAPLATLILIHV